MATEPIKSSSSAPESKPVNAGRLEDCFLRKSLGRLN